MKFHLNLLAHCPSCSGFDTHANQETYLAGTLQSVNDALYAFANEMKALNLWNNVTLIQTSDFGRTLNPNGNNGTDHAWGGNYLMMGTFFWGCFSLFPI